MRSQRALELLMFVVIALVVILSAWELSVCSLPRDGQGIGSFNVCEGDATWRTILSKPSKVISEFSNFSSAEKKQFEARAWITLVGSLYALFWISLLTAIWLVVGAKLNNIWQPSYSLMWFLQVIPFLSYASVLGALAFYFDLPMLDNVLLGIIIGIFPMIAEMLLGISKIPKEDLELLAIYDASLWRKLEIVYIPQMASSFFSGLYVAIPLAVVGVTLGDLYMGDNVGLGATVASYLKTNIDKVWIATIGIISISLLILVAVAILENRLMRRFDLHTHNH